MKPLIRTSFVVTVFFLGHHSSDTSTSHSQIIEKLDFPLFKPDWLAIEEVLLLDAIATSGLGNWEAAVCIAHSHAHTPLTATTNTRTSPLHTGTEFGLEDCR